MDDGNYMNQQFLLESQKKSFYSKKKKRVFFITFIAIEFEKCKNCHFFELSSNGSSLKIVVAKIVQNKFFDYSSRIYELRKNIISFPTMDSPRELNKFAPSSKNSLHSRSSVIF
jgi:hypothetical protein